MEEQENLQRVSENGLYLQFVKEQTLSICLTAVKQNPDAYKFVHPTFQYLVYKNRLLPKMISTRYF